MTYYKVVSVQGRKYVSASPPRVSMSLDYEIGRRTVPRIGGVLVFRELEDARAFAILACSCEVAVLRGRGEEMALSNLRLRGFFTMGVLPRSEIRFPDDAEVESIVQVVWNNEAVIDSGVFFGDWPDGTAALRWFEPEEVA